MTETKNVRVLIIGSGPAGYTAGIYASRANLFPLIYEGNQPGGQLTKPTTAEVDFSSRPFRCVDEEGDVVYADTVIVSTGASAKYLGLPDEEKYRGMGVSACATCDGFFYRKKKVSVVRGGDTACEEALYLSTLAKKVYLIVRKDYLRASDVMQKRVRDTENIEVLFNCNTVGLFGADGVEGAKIVEFKGTDKEQVFDIEIDGFFLGIGHRPNTEVFKGQLDMDAEGYIKTDAPSTRTNVEGVFAAGDCADPTYRQAISAAGTGCRAALDAERFLMSH